MEIANLNRVVALREISHLGLDPYIGLFGPPPAELPALIRPRQLSKMVNAHSAIPLSSDHFGIHSCSFLGYCFEAQILRALHQESVLTEVPRFKGRNHHSIVSSCWIELSNRC